MPTYSAGSATVQIVPDFSGAQKRIGEWFNSQGDMRMRVNPEVNQSGLRNLDRDLDNHKSKIKIEADFKEASDKALKFLDTMTGFSMVEKQFVRLFGPGSVLKTSGVGALTSLASVASTTIPILALLPAVIMSAVGPIAALAVGVQGVGDAFKALSAADSSSAADAKASAAARKAAAREVESAQKSVESAQRGTAQAARTLESAERGVDDAERQLTKAQAATLQAQNDLNKARDAAVRNLQDMNMELARASLNEEGAALAVEEAQLKLNDALAGGADAARQREAATIALQRAQAALAQSMDDPRKTALDREAATLAVADAQQALNQTIEDTTTKRELDLKEADLSFRQAKENLSEIQVQNARLAADTDAANTAGVEGAANVVAAKDKVATAVDSEAAAQRGLADAQRGVTDAQQGVADAAENLADAQKSLAEAQADAATAASGSSSAQTKAAEALAKLSPAARDFVLQVRALKGAWDGLTSVVQESLFSGLGDTITNLANAQLPTLRDGLAGIAGELNSGFKTSMSIFSSPAAVKDFATTLGNMQSLWHGIAQASAPFTQSFIDLVTVGSQFMPVLGEAIAKMATKFGDFIANARATGQLSQWIQTAIDTAKQLGTIVGNIGGTFKNVFSAALPAGQAALGLLSQITGFLKEFSGTDLAQSSLMQFFGQTMDAVKSLLPAFEALTEAAVTGLLPAISGLAKEIGPVVSGVLVQFAEVIGQLAPLIYPVLADAISTAMAALAPLIDVFGQIVAAVLPQVVDLVNRLAPLFTTLAEGVGDQLVTAVRNLTPLLGPLVDAVVAIAGSFVNWALGVGDLINGALPVLVTVLSGLLDVVKFIAPVLPVVLTAFLGFKVAGVIAAGIEAAATGMFNLGLATEALGARSAASAIGNVAGGVSKLSGVVRGAATSLSILGVALGAELMLMQAQKQKTADFAQALLEGGAAAEQAAEKMTNPGLWSRFEYNMTHWFNTQKVGNAQLDDAKEKAKELYAAMTPLQQAQQDVTGATNDLNYALSNEHATAGDVQSAKDRLAAAAQRVTDIQNKQADATKTATDRLKEEQDQIRGTVDAQLGFEQAVLRVKESQEAYDKTMADGTATDDDRKQAELDLRQSLLDAADAAKTKAEADNKGRSAAEIAKAGSDAYISTLTDLSKNLTGPAKEAMDKYIDDLKAHAHNAELTADAVHDLGLKVIGLPNGHQIIIDAPTADQKQRLLDLGYTVEELPNGKVEVTANTDEAAKALQALVDHKYEAVVNAEPGFAVPRGHWTASTNEIGGIIHAYASGGVELSPMSGGIARVVAPNTWRVIGDRVSDDEAYIPINNAPRSQEILGITADRMGFDLVPSGGAVANAVGNYLASVPRDFTYPLKQSVKAAVNPDSVVNVGNLLLDYADKMGETLAGQLGMGGPMGTGNSVVQRMFNTVKAAIPQARLNDGYRPGANDYHGLGLAVDFGFGTGPGGDGSAGLASINRWIYDHWGGKTAELIYDGIGDDRPDIKNQANHVYSADLRAQHHNHVHWAMPSFGSAGAMQNKPLYDRGGWLPPGMSTVMNASGRPEPVLTAAEHDSLMRWRALDAGGGTPSTVAGFVNNGTVVTTDLDELARTTRRGTQRALSAAGL